MGRVLAEHAGSPGFEHWISQALWCLSVIPALTSKESGMQGSLSYLLSLNLLELSTTMSIKKKKREGRKREQMK